MIKVWDIPTRLFHWLLVVAFATAMCTAESEELRNYHIWSGFYICFYIFWRILWGLFGSEWSKFKSFKPSIKNVFIYLSAKPKQHYIGHNPLGSLYIYSILTILFLAVASGVAIEYSITNYELEEIHESLSWMGVGLVSIHIIGVIITSIISKENLISSMFHGKKKN